MKHLILAAALLIGMQTPLFAQTGKISRTHQRTHYRHKRVPMYYEHRRNEKPMTSDERRPSPYKGDNTPANDGAKKNEHRNMNYNNGQPMPANNGGGR